MRHHDDDLTPFRDEPIIEALTAPGTDAELAGEADAVAAFTAANAARPRRRLAARVGTSGAVAVVTVALTGGVAAAYTATLPDSWQVKLHKELPALHIPAPKESKPKASPTPVPTSAVAAPAPTITPSPAHTTVSTPRPRTTPSDTPADLTPSPTASAVLPVTVPTGSVPTSSPTGSVPTGSAAPTPTSTRVRTAGGQLSVTVSATRITGRQAVSVSGTLTAADGTALSGRPVALVEHVAGAHGWSRIATAPTTQNGTVAFSTPPLDHNVRLRLRARHHVHSAAVKVVVVPIINVLVAPTTPGAGVTSVTVTVTAAQPGDTVVLRQGGRKGTRVQGVLDASNRATFSVPVSQRRTIHYRVVIARTKAHAAHSLPFYVPPSGVPAG